MIFFITDEKGEIEPPSLEPPKSRSLIQYRIVPWWALFKAGHKVLFAALEEVFAKDPICALMMEQFGRIYGKPPASDALLTRFTLWCHPLVGNLVFSPRPRATAYAEQAKAWSLLVGKKDSDLVEANVLEQVAKTLGDLPCVPIDECRIARNLTELARAFIGDATSAPTLQVERLLALRLSASETFQAAQASLLGRLLTSHGEVLDKQVEKGFDPCEYTTFYLPGLKRIAAQQRIPMLRALIGAARFDAWPVKGEEQYLKALDGDCKQLLMQWLSLPKVVACAALINDISKLNQKQEPKIKSLDFGALRARPNANGGKTVGPIKPGSPIEWGVEGPEKQQGFPKHQSSEVGPIGSNWKRAPLAWSWNRDEYSRSVITYRVQLCPQWGGSSGHTTGGLSFWLAALKKLETFDSVVITTSLYVLWCLCYDVRLSPVHRMVETLEETMHPKCLECVTEADAPLPKPQVLEELPLLIQVPKDELFAVVRGGKYKNLVKDSAEDAWLLLLKTCTRSPKRLATLDTIKLVFTLIEHWWPLAQKSLENLAQLVQAASDDLGSFSWLPDFGAHANRDLVGLAVRPHSGPQQLWSKMEPSVASKLLEQMMQPRDDEDD